MDSRYLGVGFEKKLVQKSERRELFPPPQKAAVNVPVSKEIQDRINSAIAESMQRSKAAEKKLKAAIALL